MVPNVVKSQNVDGICRTMNFKHSAINLAPVCPYITPLLTHGPSSVAGFLVMCSRCPLLPLQRGTFGKVCKGASSLYVCTFRSHEHCVAASALCSPHKADLLTAQRCNWLLCCCPPCSCNFPKYSPTWPILASCHTKRYRLWFIVQQIPLVRPRPMVLQFTVLVEGSRL